MNNNKLSLLAVALIIFILSCKKNDRQLPFTPKVTTGFIF